MATEIRVPTLGESVTEATIGRWLKQVGDAVSQDEPLVELETDKVAVEVPAPTAGVLSEITADVGAAVEVGGLLGTLSASSEKSATKSAAKSAPMKKTMRNRGKAMAPALTKSARTIEVRVPQAGEFGDRSAGW
ncbi:MAG: biotin/lipoyl-containing protein [Parvularculaceae bacterium]